MWKVKDGGSSSDVHFLQSCPGLAASKDMTACHIFEEVVCIFSLRGFEERRRKVLTLLKEMED